MNFDRELAKRSNDSCELCSATENLGAFKIEPPKYDTMEDQIWVCSTCSEQMNDSEKIDPNHWRCLNDSMWSEVMGVKVMAWRMLQRVKEHGWSADLLDMMYLEEEDLNWAKASGDGSEEEKLIHRDSNGAILEAGDSVVAIKDLNVKGSSIVVKRGTAVRNITLSYESAEYIEGKVDGQNIVILTKYVKK
ncbi:MAG: protein PhnA [Sphingobacteriales bacterium]|jgi:protein PhnA